MSRAKWLLLCLAPQFALVAGVVVREEQLRRSGVEVELEVRAVDPMSLFSGRYVSTPLAITRLERDRTSLPEGLERGQPVWVELRRGAAAWDAVAVHGAQPREAGLVFLRGTWMGNDEVDYGLERFYIPEDGRDPSALARGLRGGTAPLEVRVRIGSDGRGTITDLLVLGKPYSRWNADEKAAGR